jgi:hypothetical protein
MIDNITNLGGIEIPSTDALAMLSKKGRGRHSKLGQIYFWSLLALFTSATFLSAMRWVENYHLFVLGMMSFASAWFGRTVLRQRWPYWTRLHIVAMGLSYVLMLIAFYVDNGKQLPVWKDFPDFMYWLLPLLVGLPLIVRALLWHPLVQRPSGSAPSNTVTPFEL